MTEKGPALDSLIHDVNSKCSSLKSAVNLLRTASAEERRELLALMKRQAQHIARDIEAFETSEAARQGLR